MGWPYQCKVVGSGPFLLTIRLGRPSICVMLQSTLLISVIYITLHTLYSLQSKLAASKCSLLVASFPGSAHISHPKGRNPWFVFRSNTLYRMYHCQRLHVPLSHLAIGPLKFSCHGNAYYHISISYLSVN